MDEFSEVFRDASPLFAQSMEDTLLGAWIGGAADVVETLPVLPPGPPVVPGVPPAEPPIPPVSVATLYPDEEPLVRFPGLEKAISSMQTRQVLAPEKFYELSAAAKQRAFTITADLTTETLGQLRDRLADDLEQGTSRTAFIERINEEFPDLPLSEAQLEHVYRNAVNESFAQGMETILNHPMVDDAFPYRAYDAIHDDRTEDTHLAMEHLGLDGTNIYHKDDPTWERFRPPWRWQCRCGFRPMTLERAAAAGVQEAKLWLDTGVEPAHRWVDPPPFMPPAGWDRARVSV